MKLVVIQQKFNNMKTKIWIILVGILLGNISYWFNSFDEYSVMGEYIYLFMSIGPLLGSFLFTIYLTENPAKIALLIYIGVLLAYIVRIFFDINFIDSTSHNLFPFEIIGISVVTIPSAFVGAYFAEGMKRN